MTALAYAHDPAESEAHMLTTSRGTPNSLYDCARGHFLQTDPVGYGDDLNLYAYVRNDPTNVVDPTGKCKSIGDEGTRLDCETRREEAVEGAANYVANADVSVGAKEDAYIATYNTSTREVTVRTGDAAADRSGEDVVFQDEAGNDLVAYPDGRIRGTDLVVLATGHSHPRETGPPEDRSRPDQQARSRDRANEGLGPDDPSLVRIAPVVIKTPTGAVREFRSEGQCAGGCVRQEGTPIPASEYSRSRSAIRTRR